MPQSKAVKANKIAHNRHKEFNFSTVIAFDFSNIALEIRISDRLPRRLHYPKQSAFFLGVTGKLDVTTETHVLRPQVIRRHTNEVPGLPDRYPLPAESGRPCIFRASKSLAHTTFVAKSPLRNTTIASGCQGRFIGHVGSQIIVVTLNIFPSFESA